MNTINEIQHFLETKEFAIAGVSRNPNKFGRMIYHHLVKNGYTCYPVNPNMSEVDGNHCYQSVSELPENVDRLFIVTPQSETGETVKQALEKGIKNIWIQQKSESPEALELLEEKGVNPIQNQCIYMFADPVRGGHAFHRFVSKMFGAYPKQVNT